MVPQLQAAAAQPDGRIERLGTCPRISDPASRDVLPARFADVFRATLPQEGTEWLALLPRKRPLARLHRLPPTQARPDVAGAAAAGPGVHAKPAPDGHRRPWLLAEVLAADVAPRQATVAEDPHPRTVQARDPRPALEAARPDVGRLEAR